MPAEHPREIAYEKAIGWHLIEQGGYLKGNQEAFDPVRCLDPSVLIPFIKETQPKEWKYLANLQKDRAKTVLLDELGKALSTHPMKRA